MKQELENVEVHDLWLVSCFLYPFLRDMEFWNDPSERQQFRTRAEALTRQMISDGEANSLTSYSDGVICHSSDVARDESGASTNYFEPLVKRRKFSLKDQIISTKPQSNSVDQIVRYKTANILQFGTNEDKFFSDPYSIFRFWHARRSIFPKLYRTAMRLFATRASSSESERVFYVLRKIVTPDRSTMPIENNSQIIIGRSLQSFK